MDYSLTCNVCHSETGRVLESCCILLSLSPSGYRRTLLILQACFRVELKDWTEAGCHLMQEISVLGALINFF